MLIVDAGGGTIDLSAYTQVEAAPEAPPTFEEVAPIECRQYQSITLLLSKSFEGLFQGSVYVSRRAHAFLERELLPCTDALEITSHFYLHHRETREVDV